MKKIKNLFKASPVAIVVVGLVIAGIVSAALVDYLSNTVQADITVESPMVVGISEGKDSWSTTQCVNRDTNDPNYDKWVDSFPECDSPVISDWAESDWTTPLTISGIYGGETITLYTMSENLADAEITGYEEVIVTNPGITCDDFESVIVRVDSIYGSLGYGSENDALLICVQDGYNRVKFDSGQFGGLSTWGAGETDVSKNSSNIQTKCIRNLYSNDKSSPSAVSDKIVKKIW